MSWNEDRDRKVRAENEIVPGVPFDLDDEEDQSSGLDEAKRRLDTAAETLKTGPQRIAEALELLRSEVRSYMDAWELLVPLGATGDAKKPSALPGVRAVLALAKKKRGRKAAKAA